MRALSASSWCLQDLLRPENENLQIREGESGVFVAGVHEVEVKGMEDCLHLLQLGERNRWVPALSIEKGTQRTMGSVGREAGFSPSYSSGTSKPAGWGGKGGCSRCISCQMMAGVIISPRGFHKGMQYILNKNICQTSRNVSRQACTYWCAFARKAGGPRGLEKERW